MGFQLPASLTFAVRLPCLIPASLHTVLPRSSYLLRSCFDSKKHSSNAVDSDVLEMNSLPDYGDYAASDIRCSIHEDTVQVDRKSTRLNSSHSQISYAVFCLKKKKKKTRA